ncbi:MAG: iron-sulfur cluster biosynthesis family protein [Actinomycetota bacterium]
MLTISADATQAIKQVVGSSEAGENGGIRLTMKPIDDQQAKLELSLAPNPEPGDTQVEQEGANVFLDEKVAPFLDDKILDATIDAEGPSFTILDKSGEASG